MTDAVATTKPEPRLTSLSHGGGCGGKIAPGVLSEILKGTARLPLPPDLLVGIGRSSACVIGEAGARGAPATLTVS